MLPHLSRKVAGSLLRREVMRGGGGRGEGRGRQPLMGEVQLQLKSHEKTSQGPTLSSSLSTWTVTGHTSAEY